MGYYYDHVASQWVPIQHDRKLSLKQRQQISRRRVLIDNLLQELEAEDVKSVTRLYAQLLLPTLASTDELLAREYSRRIASLLHDPRIEAQDRNRLTSG